MAHGGGDDGRKCVTLLDKTLRMITMAMMDNEWPWLKILIMTDSYGDDDTSDDSDDTDSCVDYNDDARSGNNDENDDN